MKNAEIALKRAMFSLASYLNFDKNTEIRLRLPSRPRNMEISVDKALELARANNPTFLELRQQILEAQQQVDKTKKEAMFNAQINASVGFNQVSKNIQDAYKNLQQQEIVSLSVSIPLVDWGVRKGKHNIAKNNLLVTETSAKQKRIDSRRRRDYDSRRLQYPASPDWECRRSGRPGRNSLQRNQATLHDRKSGYQQSYSVAEPPTGSAAELYFGFTELLAELL